MIKYWIWLSEALDRASINLKPLLEEYLDAYSIYKAPIKEIRKSINLSENELRRFRNKSLSTANKIIAECNKSNIKVIDFNDEKYPKNLKEIDNPPACLYIKGNYQNLNNIPIVCIVGRREISDYGKMVAWSLSARLTAGGICILSGGALGGDTAAHEGAMAVGGKTIAVLPCGINYGYLKTNAFLRSQICDNGCLISELPPSTPLYRNAFQIRNRLLSGISLGVVVVEGGARSGTLITARYAAEQSRDVFVVTGRPDDKNYLGSNALLRDGAIPVFTAEDIFIEYISDYPNIIDVEKAKATNLSRLYRILNSPTFLPYKAVQQEKTPVCNKLEEKTKKKIDETLPKSLKIVYNYIDSDVFTVDDLILCGLPFEEVLASVTQLELYGYIKAISGGRYTLVY